ncbi:MAG: glycosyltransferase family 39 protein [Anaerolineae bacterium]|nr:glycosyltransferase family 39 protein [Anaerolineae bacterium]
MLKTSKQVAKWILRIVECKRVFAGVLFSFVAFLLFYNLGCNPRPWHDEGAALSLAKTLAEEGVYAVGTSEGYQTFGPVQSVGPTVVLPVALYFRFAGVGLLQGRIIAASYALLTVFLFYLCGLKLFGWRASVIAVIMLLASPTVNFVLFGRQALGEVPALGFFLAGWLTWARGVHTRRIWLYLLAGLLIGAAMITKTQYVIMSFGTGATLILLDLLYYRQKNFGGLVLIGLVASICVVIWWGWQVAYFGLDTFQENVSKLGQLAQSTTGFRLSMTLDALQYLLGSSGPVYYFWIFPAVLYVGILCAKRNENGFILAFLLLFSCFWLAYYILWIIPWPHYVLAPVAIMALFVAKLYNDMLSAFISSRRDFGRDLWKMVSQPKNLSPFTPQFLAYLGTLVALITMGLLVINQMQKIIRTDVLDTIGEPINVVRAIPQMQYPSQVAAFLEENVDKNAVIETWERELSILTDHRYHFPDQSLLAQTHAAVYHGGPRDYSLGADYFDRVRPSYVVIGFYGRLNQIYDLDFLTRHSTLIATIGQDEWRYDIYKLLEAE